MTIRRPSGAISKLRVVPSLTRIEIVSSGALIRAWVTRAANVIAASNPTATRRRD